MLTAPPEQVLVNLLVMRCATLRMVLLPSVWTEPTKLWIAVVDTGIVCSRRIYPMCLSASLELTGLVRGILEEQESSFSHIRRLVELQGGR